MAKKKEPDPKTLSGKLAEPAKYFLQLAESFDAQDTRENRQALKNDLQKYLITMLKIVNDAKT